MRALDEPKLPINVDAFAAVAGTAQHMEEFIDNSPIPRYLQREAARRNAENHFSGRRQRTDLAKEDAAAQSAVDDAKTLRLRALRLARDEAEAQSLKDLPQPPRSAPGSSKS